jgi:hypothetical protein
MIVMPVWSFVLLCCLWFLGAIALMAIIIGIAIYLN